MIRCPINYILVKIKEKYDDELVFKSGVKLHIDPSWNPNFHATMVGKVVSLPVAYTADRKVNQTIDIDDEILFNYKVVGDTSFENDPKAFRLVTKGEGYLMEWQNADRETLKMQLVNPDKKIWAGVYIGPKDEIIDGRKGTQGEIESWTSQFKFTRSQSFMYDHEVEYEGETYWKVDLSFVFAVKKKGSWVMLGEYVMVEPLVEKKPDLMESGLYRTTSSMVVVREDKGFVRYISKTDKWLGVLPGDVILFDGKLKEKYNVEGKPMYMVRQRYILAKE